MAPQKLALLVVVALLPLHACPPAAAREAPAPFQSNHRHSLEGRLMSGWATVERYGFGGMAECWGALLEVRACTNEIVLFFLNGEAYLGQGCCRAIRLITHHCWPSMLTSVGFTAEEGDILSDYCAMGEAPLPPSPAPAPAPSGIAETATY